jgi:hypothetical protein
MNEVAEKLRECPFCGGEGRIESSPLSTLSWPAWKHTSKCPMNAAMLYPNRQAALEAGNTRAESDNGH